MEKEFISYELALELKELGFDEPCFGYWSNWAVQEPFLLTCELGKEIESASINRKNILFKAPTFSQAYRWLYQKLGIEKGVMPLDIESQQLLLKELIDKVSSKHLLV